jgi:hypothetical protein
MDIIDKRAEMAKEHIRLMKDKYTKETKFSIRQSKIYSPNSIFQKQIQIILLTYLSKISTPLMRQMN